MPILGWNGHGRTYAFALEEGGDILSQYLTSGIESTDFASIGFVEARRIAADEEAPDVGDTSRGGEVVENDNPTRIRTDPPGR